MRVAWTLRAANQLEAAAASREAEDQPRAAAALVRRVVAAVEQLRRFPLSGHRVRQFPDSAVREILIPSFRILYLLDGRRVVILSIKHMRETLATEDLRPDFP